MKKAFGFRCDGIDVSMVTLGWAYYDDEFIVYVPESMGCEYASTEDREFWLGQLLDEMHQLGLDEHECGEVQWKIRPTDKS